MHPNDVKAVAELSELARVLSAIEEIKKEQKEANFENQVCETEDGREYGRIIECRINCKYCLIRRKK